MNLTSSELRAMGYVESNGRMVKAAPVKQRKRGSVKAEKVERERLACELLCVTSPPDGVTAKLTPGKPNRTEQAYLDIQETRLLLGEIAAYAFAPIRLRVGVGSCWYSPDILIRDNSGGIRVVECKGWRWANGITKVKSAALQFPKWHFSIASRRKNQWFHEDLS